ncbi:MAG TPA: terpene synthase family protein, partial [Polyangiaceae bacterium]|nr:terpene synthase family protein [Polyangiaceae bacterium]
PVEVATFLRSIFGALDPASESSSTPTSEAASLFVPALRSIWSRVAPGSAPALRTRFLRHVANYIDGCVWEAENRRLAQVPSRAVFQAMRMFTSTLYQFWDFIEYAGGFCLPDEVVEHPLLVELQRSANAVASYANDIFSLRKENHNRDFHNLVSVLQHEEDLPLSAAYAKAIALHDDQVRHFCTLERLVPRFEGETGRNVAAYLEGMRIWMRANYDWSIVTPRYAEIPDNDVGFAGASASMATGDRTSSHGPAA